MLTIFWNKTKKGLYKISIFSWLFQIFFNKLTETNKVWTAFTGKGHDIMDTNRSELIKNGLKKSFQSSSSAKASTSCYGYKTTTDGNLIVYPVEAIYVIHIFDRFVAGDSLVLQL